MVKVPNGTIALVQQTDLGPAPSTGRTFDFTYSLLNELGYTQQSFPTGGSAQGIYLGKAASSRQAIVNYGTKISNALGALGASPQQTAAFIGQADSSQAEQSGATFAVSPSGKPASPAGTKILSGADPAGINPPGIPDPLKGIPQAIAAVFNQAVKDAKFAAVTVAVLALGAVMIFHAFRGSGSGEKTRVVPV